MRLRYYLLWLTRSYMEITIEGRCPPPRQAPSPLSRFSWPAQHFRIPASCALTLCIWPARACPGWWALRTIGRVISWSRGWIRAWRWFLPWGCSCTMRGCICSWGLPFPSFRCCCRPGIRRCSSWLSPPVSRCSQCWWFCCFWRWWIPRPLWGMLPVLSALGRCTENIRCRLVWTTWWCPCDVLNVGKITCN